MQKLQSTNNLSVRSSTTAFVLCLYSMDTCMLFVIRSVRAPRGMYCCVLVYLDERNLHGPQRNFQ